MEDGQSLYSSSSDSEHEEGQKINQNIIQAENQTEKKEESDSQQDSQIDDLEEKMPSEKSDDGSFFECENQISDDEDKDSQTSKESNDLIATAFDRENEDENVYEDSEEENSQKEKQVFKGSDGPKIPINLRDYQKTLFQKSQDRNSIVYLPTGLGKTRIAIASMFYYLSYTQKKKIVFLANTVQLVKQQAEAIKRTLHGILQNKFLCKELNKKHSGNEIQLDWNWDRICRQVVCIHGQKNDDIGQTKKKKIESSLMSKKEFLRKFENSTVIVVISQMFLNCLRRGFIKLTDFSFIVFDECHHCKGDHPYAGIMNQFYFDLKKKMEKGGKGFDKNETLPKIMGLTASPIPDPERNEKKLERLIQELCINLDSNFVEYPNNQNGNQTKIQIVKIEESQQKRDNPMLLKFFTKNTTHKISYQKIQYYFPLYSQCIKQIIDLMSSRHECLKLICSPKQIHHPELFFFYDIKDCLLIKIKDLWLELGEYVMCLALGDLITQLNNVVGLKDQGNEHMLRDIIKILLKHEHILKKEFDFNNIPERFMSAKLIKLIKLLNSEANNEDKTEDEKLKNDDLVLVFAFKRRTVEYLDKFFSKYRDKLPKEKKRYFECTGVTGYSSRNSVRVLNEGQSYETNPSSRPEQFTIDDSYNKYLQDYQDTMKNTTGQSNALKSELNRFRNAKIGKFLLQTQEKYSSQLKKIMQFRNKEKRVLISTSVTEEGFDIPGCNKVISFDTPFSMKAYIQIKGRARKRNSTYYIFTDEVNYTEMKQNSQVYEDTINATYEIAINRIAKKQIRSDKRKEKIGYKKVLTKGGALLNSNYALEILKIYFATLAQPNKGYFHYILTPNVCYICVIKMPASDPSGIQMFVGQAYSTKDQSLKSAAFAAVKQLKILGLIKDDLRPSKIQQLQDQLQLQKFDDLGTIQRDQEYRQIFKKYTQFEQETDQTTKRTFLRIHFQSLRSFQLDFPHINSRFQDSYEFKNKKIKFPFQLYHVNFSNTRNHPFMKEYDNSNEIGILTCFDEKMNDKLFSNFCYRFEENPNESFGFKVVNTMLQLTMEEYVRLRKIHEFLIAACDNKEIVYYVDQTNQQPFNKQYKQYCEAATFVYDKKREFYPILVLLKCLNNKGQKRYIIDDNKIEKIRQHDELFKSFYRFYNRPKNVRQTQKFPQNLTQDFQSFATHLQGNQTITLVQSITSDFLFHKCLVKNRAKNPEQIIHESKKQNAKHNLQKRDQKFLKIFDHFKSEKGQLVQIEMWKAYEKQKRLTFFDQGGIKEEVLKHHRFYFLKQFVEYPISPQTLFKISLAKRYVYDALYSYTKAMTFLNIRLREIFVQLDSKPYHPLKFDHTENVILANSDLIFQVLADSGKSKHLRQLGRSYTSKKLNNSMNQGFNQSLNNSQFPNMSEISAIEQANNTLNMSAVEKNNESVSMLNLTKSKVPVSIVNEESVLSQKQRTYLFNPSLIDKINIPDIQKVLTSKTFKHQKSQNYEEFEFIGDVVLKYLATLQIFCIRPKAVEGEMHIARANIICNANLHKKSIKAEIFRYIMASKNLEPCPPYKISYDESKVEKQKYTGKNNEYESFNIMKVNKASQWQGYQYIGGKVHADVVEALIGAFYYAKRKLQDCQELLYALKVLKTPSLDVDINLAEMWKYENLPACYTQLQNTIGYIFNHKGLLIQALTHQTFRSTLETIIDDHNMSRLLETTQNQADKLNFSIKQQEDYRTKIKFHQTFYERLEFLGDAVLDLIVVEHLYDKYDRGLDEGTLTLLKQAGVSNKSLGLIAVKFKLHELTLMDIPELDNLQRQFSKLSSSFDEYLAHPQKLQTLQINEIKLLGDVFQGLIGAILIDNNFDYYRTKEIVWKMIGKYIEIFTDKNNVKGFPVMTFLKNNNYTNCRIEKISKETKNGKFEYGLIDRKHTTIERCFAANEKDAWDIIMEKIQAKQKGTYAEGEQDESD